MNTKNMTDMTVGSPTKHILQFAWPLLLGNLFQQFYNMVDSIVVGKFVGADALAAVGTCGSTSFLFFSLSAGLAMGIGVIVSQYYGARDEERVKAAIGNAFYVLVCAAIVVSILGTVLAPSVLRLLQTPENIMPDAVTYLRTTCIGIIAIAVYNGIASILRALGDSKTPLVFLIIASIINVVLDLVFVLVFHWDVFGVAFATVLSQFICAIAGLIYAYIKIPYFHLTKEQLKPERYIIINSFKLGVPVAFQNSMIAISCMVLQGVVNGFGETVMATYTITGRIDQIVQQPYGSISMALTTYAGQNIGSNKIDRVKQGYRQSMLMIFLFNLVMIPIIYFGGAYIVNAFVDDPAVIKMGADALKITSICYLGLGMIYVPRAVLNGCGDTGFSMITGA
ncbi:MAG TPA: MATE family efflux transporter, partial [Lachnospiraceae bacterium]|nr:MATE family efflux transporter [Lachnospiraceae bacterium]